MSETAEMSGHDHRRVRRHLRSMRALVVSFLATVPAAGVAAHLLQRLSVVSLSPTAVTLAAIGCALWFAFTADRSARTRLTGIRHAFADHRDDQRLLDDHLRVYLAVLLRLEVLTGCALAVAVWGTGTSIAIAILIVAALLMLLAWPSEDKVLLLLRRARDGVTVEACPPEGNES